MWARGGIGVAGTGVTRADRPLAIIGPTASGKSALALDVARALGTAEIVSADSMQVYRRMDIGTDTPSMADQAEIAHHLINLVEPAEEFTVAEFQRMAVEAIDGISSRGSAAVLVGGSGLYLRAVIDRFDIPGRYPRIRSELESEPDTPALHRRLSEIDPVAAARMQPTNRRRVLRALEVTLGSGRVFSSHGPGMGEYPPTAFVMVGLKWPKPVLDERISARLNRQISDGFLDEVRALRDRPLSRTAAQALGYRDLTAHLNGELSLEEALERTIARTRRFARRQVRWFRRDPRIAWLDGPAGAADVLEMWDAGMSVE